MGRFGSYWSRKQILDELKAYVIRGACVGNHFWTVQRAKDGTLFIGLDMIERNGKDDWSYRPLDETMGPVALTCPQSILDEVPDPCIGHSTAWRAKVAEHKANKALRRKLCRRTSDYLPPSARRS